MESKGYHVLPPKPFQQRFWDAFEKDPLCCPKCQNSMVLEFIYHPKYGIIKEYEIFEDVTDERQIQPREQSSRIAI